MEILLQTYYIILPIVATALVGWVGTLLSKQQKREEERLKKDAEKEAEIKRVRQANSNGIKLILRYMLRRYHTEYMIQGYITYTQYEDWKDIFDCYKALNGNSMAMDWNNEVQKLERRLSSDDISPYEAMMRNYTKKFKRDI